MSKIIQALKQIFAKKKEKKEVGHPSLVEWKKLQEALKDHPLTQAKIINEQLLRSTSAELEKIDRRINLLDERVGRLEEGKKAGRKPRKIKEEKPKVRISEVEKEIISIIKKSRWVQAAKLAKKLKVSRSNASLKLNKLYSEDLLKKKIKGKNVFYSLK